MLYFILFDRTIVIFSYSRYKDENNWSNKSKNTDNSSFQKSNKKQDFICCISYNNIGFMIKMLSLTQFLDHFHTYLYLFLG